MLRKSYTLTTVHWPISLARSSTMGRFVLRGTHSMSIVRSGRRLFKVCGLDQWDNLFATSVMWFVVKGNVIFVSSLYCATDDAEYRRGRDIALNRIILRQNPNFMCEKWIVPTTDSTFLYRGFNQGNVCVFVQGWLFPTHGPVWEKNLPFSCPHVNRCRWLISILNEEWRTYETWTMAVFTGDCEYSWLRVSLISVARAHESGTGR